jgi:homoserine dehydrogenase
MISRENPLANVEDVFNAILVVGDALGDVMFYGRGAGKLPTASAVVADIIDIGKHLNNRRHLFWEEERPELLGAHEDSRGSSFIRARCKNPKDALLSAEEIFGPCKEIRYNGNQGEIGIITAEKSEGEIRDGLEKLRSSAAAGEILAHIRVLN